MNLPKTSTNRAQCTKVWLARQENHDNFEGMANVLQLSNFKLNNGFKIEFVFSVHSKVNRMWKCFSYTGAVTDSYFDGFVTRCKLS